MVPYGKYRDLFHRQGWDRGVGTNASFVLKFVKLSRSGVWASRVMYLTACLHVVSVKGTMRRLSRSSKELRSAMVFVELMSLTRLSNCSKLWSSPALPVHQPRPPVSSAGSF